MKENGIGRPSTRANIIETLFKRKYISRNKKQLLPTSTGIELIAIIQNKLLTSAELTGQWEKQLKEIEKGDYHAGTFIKNMKLMVDHLVYEVRSNNSKKIISHTNVSSRITLAKNAAKSKKDLSSQTCPKCKKGALLKGSAAFGCSEYKNGCDFKIPFQFAGKKISENQYLRLLTKGSTVNLKGFKSNEGTAEGLIRFDDNFNLVLEPKKGKVTKIPDEIRCPKCKKGNILKGNKAYGCSEFKSSCDFMISFDTIRQKAADRPLTKELVFQLIHEHN